MPAALLAALMTALLAVFREGEITSWWNVPFPYQMFQFMLSLFLVFR